MAILHRYIIAALIGLITAPAVAAASDNIDGKALYAKNCASCHGASGGISPMGKSLKPYPARNHRAIAKYASRNELRRIITNGVEGTSMTPKKYSLDPLQIEAVIDYIRTFEYTPDLVNGKKRFEAVCSGCHGMDGRAKTGVGAKNLVYSNLDLKGIVHTMRYGRPGTLMTSKRHQLSNTDIADIANYVYSLRHLASAEDGRKLYTKNCATCHATPASIKLFGNAAAKRSIRDMDDRELDLRIRHGRHVDRAGEHIAHLSDDDIQDLIAYIRQQVK